MLARAVVHPGARGHLCWVLSGLCRVSAAPSAQSILKQHKRKTRISISCLLYDTQAVLGHSFWLLVEAMQLASVLQSASSSGLSHGLSALVDEAAHRSAQQCSDRG